MIMRGARESDENFNGVSPAVHLRGHSVTGMAAPGWYPPDPTQPHELRYWDGTAWTQHLHTMPTTPVPVQPVAAVPAAVGAADSPSSTARNGIKAKAGIAAAVVLCGALALAASSAQQGQDSTAGGTDSAAVVVGDPSNSPSGDASSESTTEPSAPSESDSPSTPTVVPPSPTPKPSASSPPASGTAAAAVNALVVKGRAAKTGYARDRFGTGWVDVNRNGCDTRNDMLARDLTNLVMSGSCKVMAGTLKDPYTAQSIRFVRGGPSEVDVDHMVPLSDAWQKGAQSWAFAKRVAFANDPLNLQPTDSSTNRQKGDSDAASWLPPNKSYRCMYVARQAAVKKKYGLWVTSAEKAAMLRVLGSCPGLRLPPPGSQPTLASNTGGSDPYAAPS